MEIFGKRSWKILKREFLSDHDPYGLSRFSPDKIKTILDLGANIGLFSIAARFRFPAARIIAVEPNAETYAVLCRNVKHLRIETAQLAFGSGKSVRRREGRMSLSHQFNENGDGPAQPSYSLRDLVRKFRIEKPSTFLKMDVEGAERHMLVSTAERDCLRQFAGIGIELHETPEITLGRLIHLFLWGTKVVHRVEISAGRTLAHLCAVRQTTE